MSESSISIDRLIIDAEGFSAAEAYELGGHVQYHLGVFLSGLDPHSLAGLRRTGIAVPAMQWPTGVAVADLAPLIVSQVAASMRQAGG